MPPHFTLYNQTSGYSAFHFLPLLLGLYATHVGRYDGAAALRALLAELERRGIGELATIGPKQMLLILPAGSHGVYVPRPSLNPSLAPFDLSVIRAAELYVWPVHQLFEARLSGAGPRAWYEVLSLTAEEAAREAKLLDRFAALQERACAELQLSRQEWTYAATCLSRRWDAERAAREAEAEAEGVDE